MIYLLNKPPVGTFYLNTHDFSYPRNNVHAYSKATHLRFTVHNASLLPSKEYMDKNKSNFLAAKGLSNVPPAGVVGGTSNFLYTCDHAGVKFFADKKTQSSEMQHCCNQHFERRAFFLTDSEKIR